MTKSQLKRFVAKIRFIERDEDLGECWEWAGACYPAGYGKLGLCGQTLSAHRASYAHFVGPIPGGAQIDHLCRNKGCVNPRHLEAVMAAVNVQRGLSPLRMAVIGRGWKGKSNPHSPEHRTKLLAVLARNRAVMRGSPRSIETRQKMAVARRAWWARKREQAA